MILVDANVFMYAAGKPSPQRGPCQRFLRDVLAGLAGQVCTDAEVLQEVLHRYRSIGAADTGYRLFDAVLSLGIPILAVGEAEVAEARRLLAEHTALSTRDGVHLGVMRTNGVRSVLTYDRDFDAIPWVERREP